jgi:CRP-like cAMP-binding protein
VSSTPVDVLRRIPLFAELGPAELESVGEAMSERTFSRGETVTSEGAPSDGFFVVAGGRAEVTVAGQPRGVMNPGDSFGEIALLMGSERTATVTAATDLRCYALAPSDFRALVEGNPSIAWNVLQSMAARLE